MIYIYTYIHICLHTHIHIYIYIFFSYYYIIITIITLISITISTAIIITVIIGYPDGVAVSTLQVFLLGSEADALQRAEVWRPQPKILNILRV